MLSIDLLICLIYLIQLIKLIFFLLCYVFKVSKEYAGTFGSLFEIARRCKVCKEGRLMECHEVAA